VVSSTGSVDPADHDRRRYRAVVAQVSIDAATYCSSGVAAAVLAAAVPAAAVPAAAAPVAVAPWRPPIPSGLLHPFAVPEQPVLWDLCRPTLEGPFHHHPFHASDAELPASVHPE